jgi:hypothetical protein
MLIRYRTVSVNKCLMFNITSSAPYTAPKYSILGLWNTDISAKGIFLEGCERIKSGWDLLSHLFFGNHGAQTTKQRRESSPPLLSPLSEIPLCSVSHKTSPCCFAELITFHWTRSYLHFFDECRIKKVKDWANYCKWKRVEGFTNRG